MANIETNILGEVATYYSSKVKQHGATPRGVDWNGKESQTLRFFQLCKIIDGSNHFSVCDIGCGYGAFCDYLTERYDSFAYTGVDVSGEMIRVARQQHQKNVQASFQVSAVPDGRKDYCIASGIFNVRLTRQDDEWLSYIDSTLEMLDRNSRRGFAFNCLTRYSDADKMKDYLFYADPCRFFDLCKRRFSRNITLLHDYDLYEFTILVRKDI